MAAEQTISNVIKGQHYRFTILTPGLIRMEYSDINEFTDCQTQVVVDRSFPMVPFRIEETEDELKITTEVLCIQYNRREFSPEGLQVLMTGQFSPFSARWNYGDMPRDLKGTARTLDEADGSIPLEQGVLSFHGWSLLDDSRSLLINEDGWIRQRTDENAKDIYFFGYGRNYLECLKDYHHLTGEVPLLPRYALGNWWSRYYKYTEKTYMELIDRFEQEQIPFTVSVLDMDWHVTDIDPKYGTGWTGYTWNREYFPEPEKFLEMLHNHGFKVTLNIHPADGIRAFEDGYPEFAEYMGVDVSHEEAVAFDAGNPKFWKGYFDYIHHPLEEQGVDFWWIDWQQGTKSGIKGLDPLWMLNHYHYLDHMKNHGRGMIFSRYAGPGSHRYPIGFSGDTIISWDSLRFQPYFTATASNIGYGWWSHDIGGHMNGVKNDELAARWLQFGVFSPIMRLHSSCNEFNGKEPWRYNLIVQQTMKRFLRLRHKMIPYIYTMSLRASRESEPLIQPIYYHNPDNYEAYEVKNEYYFGSEMIVCPITDPMDKETNRAVFSGWLPEGEWTDLFTGMIYEGNRRIDFYRGIDNIPILMKSGAVVVLDGRESGNEIDLPQSLEICVNAVGSGNFVLQEDDGKESFYVEEKWAQTEMKIDARTEVVFSIGPSSGNLNVLPAMRDYKLRFYGCDKSTVSYVNIDGKRSDDYNCNYDQGKGILNVYLPKIGIDQKIEVCLTGMHRHDNQKCRRIFEYLDQAEIEFNLKSRIYQIAEQADHNVPLAYVMAQLQQLETRREIIGPVLEILSSKV